MIRIRSVLPPALGQPAVRGGVPELVSMQAGDADGETAAADHEPDPVGLQRAFALLGQPQLRPGRSPVREPGLAGIGRGRARWHARRQAAAASALAEDMRDAGVEVHVVHHQAGYLAEPAAGVVQQPEDRLAPAVDEMV
jgi:hypothetical protein